MSTERFRLDLSAIMPKTYKGSFMTPDGKTIVTPDKVGSVLTDIRAFPNLRKTSVYRPPSNLH